VRFSCTVAIWFVPTYKEFQEENLHEHLWWNISDYNCFKQSTLIQVKLVLEMYPSLDTSAALKLIDSAVEVERE
jgi:hypothetical protein